MNHRLLVRGVAVLGVLVASLAMTGDAKAGLPYAGIVDLTVDVTSLPDVVAAQPDAGTIYRITVANGPVSLGGGARVTGTLPASFTFIKGDPRCSADGDVVTCDIANVLPGVPATVDVRAAVGSTLGTFPFEVTVTSTDLTEPLEYTENNKASTETQVVAADDGGGQPAYVCGGCKLTFSDPEVGSAELVVPAGNGVIVRLSADDSLEGDSCGRISNYPATCGVALSVVYNEDEADYQVTDPKKPIQVHFTPVQAPCRGLGTPTCAPIGFYDPSKDLPGPAGDPKPMPKCDGAGTGDNPGMGHAYVGGVYHVCRDSSYKAAGGVRHVVLMGSKDPLLPPLSLGK
jgi:hypothetical protein